ncbi:hypothetical protein [Massilia violaceinigra]|uniref:hypothetical protein n=1 Tax=Massilia violaceinigra TaxID=2045208 RepID=UPI0012FE04A5|nr:hypothetical protein [Massilia violaceinigra]
MSVLFSGTYTLPDPRDATKNYLKMKRLLHGCERYRQWNLERQFLDKKLVWKLGEFVDDEVERLLPECEKQGIAIEFRVYSDE